MKFYAHIIAPADAYSTGECKMLVRNATTGKFEIVDMPVMTETDPVWTAAITKTLTEQATIPSGANLNTYTSTGIFNCLLNAVASGGTNFPYPQAGVLEVTGATDSRCYQTYTVYHSGASGAIRSLVYTRQMYAGTWSAWERMARVSDVSFTETDPTVPSHVKSITTTNISNWNSAYSWGNHSGLYVLLSGSYANPTWLTSLAWSKITGAPTIPAAANNGTLTINGAGIATGSQTFSANQATNATATITVPGTNLGTTANWGDVTSSTGSNINLQTLGRSVTTDGNETPATVGFNPTFNTTGSTNYPTASGGGFRFARAAGSAIGSMSFWTDATGSDDVWFKTGLTASTWNSWQRIASKEYVTNNFIGNGSANGSLIVSEPIDANAAMLKAFITYAGATATNLPVSTGVYGGALIHMPQSAGLRFQIYLDRNTSSGGDGLYYRNDLGVWNRAASRDWTTSNFIGNGTSAGSNITVTSAIDLNTLSLANAGFVNNATNTPYGTVSGTVMTLAGTGSGMQTFMRGIADAYWYRIKSGGTFGDWYQHASREWVIAQAYVSSNLAGFSILGRSVSTAGTIAAITAAATNTVLHRRGTDGLVFDRITGDCVHDNSVDPSKLSLAGAATLLGNPTGAAASYQGVGIGAGLKFTGTILNLESRLKVYTQVHAASISLPANSTTPLVFGSVPGVTPGEFLQVLPLSIIAEKRVFIHARCVLAGQIQIYIHNTESATVTIPASQMWKITSLIEA